MSDIKAPPPLPADAAQPLPPRKDDPPRDDGPWDAETKRAFVMKDVSEFFDPCQEAARASIKCLHRNGGDRSFCGDYFQAYRACKKEWMDRVRDERKKLGRKASW